MAMHCLPSLFLLILVLLPQGRLMQQAKRQGKAR